MSTCKLIRLDHGHDARPRDWRVVVQFVSITRKSNHHLLPFPATDQLFIDSQYLETGCTMVAAGSITVAGAYLGLC
jgi:hypothetical protein